MKPTDRIKRAAFEKALDYFLADPEPNAVKIMDLLDKVAPANLFPASAAPSAPPSTRRTTGTSSSCARSRTRTPPCATAW